MAVEDVTFCVTTIPGPAGPAGTNGTNGTNGNNAYTTTTASFVMPAEGANVAVSVVSNAWAGVGQIVYIEAGGAKGYFEVISKGGSTTLTVQNLESTASATYAINSAPGTNFASGATVSPAGLQGPQGSAAAAGAPTTATYITQTPSAGLSAEQALSGLASGLLYSTTGTGVLSIAIGGTDYYGPSAGIVAVLDGGTGANNAAGARTNLGLVIGTNVQAYDATLQSISSLGTAADRYAYTTGIDTWAEGTITAFARTLLDDANAATMQATLGITAPTAMAMLLFAHIESGGTADAFTTGSWVTVPLNTEVVDTGSHGSLAANTMTLAAGTYRFDFGVSGAQVNRFQGRLYNVTDAGVLFNVGGTVACYGATAAANSGTTDSTLALGQGRFTLATAKDIRLEAYCETTGTFGLTNSFGGDNVYSWVKLWKE